MTVTLVIGAAASGKSAYAESLCLGHDGPRVYLATMEPFGEEGARRIARHRALREGKGFSTLERTRDGARGARRQRTARSGRCVYGGGHRRRVRRWDALR